MPSAPLEDYREEELLADVIAGLIADARHAAIGAASPIPAAAAMLARERGNGRPRVSLLGSRRHNFFTDGGRELFDCAGQGRIDVFFLSGGQIDGEANINLVSIGDYQRPKARFPGSFGSSYMYYVVPKVVLFRLEHTRRTLVPKVDFISAPGTSPENVHRPGGPIALITNRCLFGFDRERRRFRLASVHPGHTVAEIDRAYRLRVRPARRGAGDAGALARDAAPSAHRDRARACGGLSAVRRQGVRDCSPNRCRPRASGDPVARDRAGWRGGATSDSQGLLRSPLKAGTTVFEWRESK